MNILYVYADFPNEMNCSIHNCLRPAEAINKYLPQHHAHCIHFTNFIKNDPGVTEQCEKADIIIVERNLFQDVLTVMTYWKVRGKTIMTIFDDGYHCIHHKNPTYNFWKKGEVKFTDESGTEHLEMMNPLPLEQMKWGLEISAGLQTVSSAIADYWKTSTDTYVIHNNIYPEKYIEAQPLFKHPKHIYIGWTGSLSHFDSFDGSGLTRAFRKICNKYSNVRILISHDPKVFELIDVPKDKKIFQPFVPDDKYPSLIKSLDIYTIPLFGPYDQCRSQIKPVEAMACGVPVIATNFPNYAHLKDYVHMTENGWQNWEESISNAIENIDTYKEMAKDLGVQFAKTQSYENHVQERIDLYQHVMDKGYNREQANSVIIRKEE